MSPNGLGNLVAVLSELPLLDGVQLEELTRTLQARFPDPQELAVELIRRGWITSYQVEQIIQGKGTDLVLGQYVLLDKLGEGGMGQVFKARHRIMNRVVALKVIRSECLQNPTSIRRFQREIQAVAKLAHPNVVLAYDADQVGNTHFLVMEYVEGLDLARFVERRGPLPVGLACEFIRQAACGLEHAHEHGLIHRDIKPSNLLVTHQPASTLRAAGGLGPVPSRWLVKILDLGLARLRSDLSDHDEGLTALTQQGGVVGTPDYMAPEQARDSRTVDIRADLYSLGGTLHYLLTGRVPFPGGTVGEKLYRHWCEEPTPVESLRPEVPPEISAIVRRLLAKKPEERYSRPVELAAALAPWSTDDAPEEWGREVMPGAPTQVSLPQALVRTRMSLPGEAWAEEKGVEAARPAAGPPPSKPPADAPRLAPAAPEAPQLARTFIPDAAAMLPPTGSPPLMPTHIPGISPRVSLGPSRPSDSEPLIGLPPTGAVNPLVAVIVLLILAAAIAGTIWWASHDWPSGPSYPTGPSWWQPSHNDPTG
ncbi:MAG: protein kinase [Gemmataceae bacterium]|nr:protein kinase [Gemmataceae bacterium]MDW8264571.1 protein kinase [Gemmataceae bacterium]